MAKKKHKQSHTAVPRGKRVRVVLKNGDTFIDKFIERRAHEVVFEKHTTPIADMESMTIYRVPPHVQKACEGKVDYKSRASKKPINLEFDHVPSAAEVAKALEGTGVNPKVVMSKIKSAVKKRR